MKLIITLMAFLASFVAPAVAADVSPDLLLKTTAEEVLTIIRKDPDIQNGSSQKLTELVEKKVLPHFDFERMTGLAVGLPWKRATPEQKQALTNEFKMLLVRTYSTTLSQYRNQTVVYKPFKMEPQETDVVVKTEILQPGGQPIRIEYNMEKTNTGWKVYNIAVDDVSLVITYKSTFATEIRSHGIDGLIKTLADKNKSVKGGSMAGSAKKAG